MVRLRIVLLMTITASALQFTPVYVLARQDPTVSFKCITSCYRSQRTHQNPRRIRGALLQRPPAFPCL